MKVQQVLAVLAMVSMMLVHLFGPVSYLEVEGLIQEMTISLPTTQAPNYHKRLDLFQEVHLPATVKQQAVTRIKLFTTKQKLLELELKEATLIGDCYYL